MSDLRQLKRQTRTLLTELGTSPDEVFESLSAAGVHGVPKDNRSCAVARYLTALMGSDPRVRTVNVGHCSLLIDTAAPPEFRPAGRLLVQLPKPVRQFVAAFDARRYPAIIQEQPAAAKASTVAAR
ncbi:MAG: hypothetical protein ABSC41_18075 [Acidimicrobiales bacterium]|jgi:hypothetical protein